MTMKMCLCCVESAVDRNGRVEGEVGTNMPTINGSDQALLEEHAESPDFTPVPKLSHLG